MQINFILLYKKGVFIFMKREIISNNISAYQSTANIMNKELHDLIDTAQKLNGCSLAVLQALKYGDCDPREYQGAIRDIHDKAQTILGEAAAIERAFANIQGEI